MNKRIGTGRKADIVAGDLLQRIVTGDLEVGDTLPREAELGEEYGVNRSVIREAVKLLEVHRLVRPVRRRGTEVLDPMASVSPEVLRAMLKPGGERVDRDVLAGVLEIRALLDAEMAGLAAERRTDEDIAAMRDAIEGMREALGDADAYEIASAALSATIARATRNPVFVMLGAWNRMVIADLEDLFRLARPPIPQHLRGIEALVDAIAAGDADTVRRVVTAFHRWTNPRILVGAALASGDPVELSAKDTP